MAAPYGAPPPPPRGYGAPVVEEKNGQVEGMGRIEEIGEFSWYMKILE